MTRMGSRITRMTGNQELRELSERAIDLIRRVDAIKTMLSRGPLRQLVIDGGIVISGAFGTANVLIEMSIYVGLKPVLIWYSCTDDGVPPRITDVGPTSLVNETLDAVRRYMVLDDMAKAL